MTEPVKQNNNVRYFLALAIIKKLWVAGHITEEEMRKINARNKETFCAS